jgi:hypothetical protein
MTAQPAAALSKIPSVNGSRRSAGTPPCRLKSNALSCDLYPGRSDLKGALYGYYCALANHDLDRAFQMWAPGRERDWFYQSSANFCQVDDFRLHDITTLESQGGQAKVSYTLDLLDRRGNIIETRKMIATLVKTGDLWSLKTNLRQ